MNIITVAVLILTLLFSALPAFSECSKFVAWVKPAIDLYQKKHRVHPVPQPVRELATRFMPRLWVHPGSWQPIDFDDYLQGASLVDTTNGQVVDPEPDAASLSGLSYRMQCRVHLEAEPVKARQPAPVYIQVYHDESPVDPAIKWTYIKYNWVFDWSGLAADLNFLSRMGAWIGGGGLKRWHRLDIHTAAILAFDQNTRLRMLTLAQHNHQQTYIAGIDFKAAHPPLLAAAIRSNEIYLDHGASAAVEHRVVPFFDDIAYLIDRDQKPNFYAHDRVYGRKAGAEEIKLRPVFMEPGHPLTDFAGLLGPPRRLLGRYIGRDGPPGMHYYALPAYIPLVNFAAMGFWRSGDLDLLNRIEPLLKNKGDMKAIDWQAMVDLMRRRLTAALDTQGE